MRDNMFEQLDFGAFKEYIDDDDITDISYTNNGQIWLRSLEKGSFRVENPKVDNSVVEKLAFQCSNVMGTTFNNASPFLDAESPELRMNFVHESIATNGIALVIRKTPAKIRLKEENLLKDDYVTKDIHDFLIKCVLGHCNILVCGETGSGKTEFVKYLASHTKESEKIITIEDTLELHLDRIYPHRDIVSMKTNNIASYSDVLVTCMRQNPKWILLSEVRSAEAVSAVRNSISSGHNILSTIHSDKASAVPHRLYSLMETDLDVDQFLNTIYRYVQLAVHIKAYYSASRGKFHREIDEITEFYIDEETNQPVYNVLYHKTMTGKVVKKKPSKHLMDYLLGQNIDVKDTVFSDEVNPDEEDDGSKEEFDLDKIVEESQQVESSIDTSVVPGDDQAVSNVDNNISTNSVENSILGASDNKFINDNIVDNSNLQSNVVENNNLIVSNIEQTLASVDNVIPEINDNQFLNNVNAQNEVIDKQQEVPLMSTPVVPVVEEPIMPSVENIIPNPTVEQPTQINDLTSVNTNDVMPKLVEPILSNQGVVSDQFSATEKPKFFPFDLMNNQQPNS